MGWIFLQHADSRSIVLPWSGLGDWGVNIPCGRGMEGVEYVLGGGVHFWGLGVCTCGSSGRLGDVSTWPSQHKWTAFSTVDILCNPTLQMNNKYLSNISFVCTGIVMYFDSSNGEYKKIQVERIEVRCIYHVNSSRSSPYFSEIYIIVKYYILMVYVC